jgi:hypothetical protein
MTRKHSGRTGEGGRCRARTTHNTRCQLAAGWGTDHPGYGPCKLHGGSTPTHTTRAVRQMVEAELMTNTDGFGTKLNVGPDEALLNAIAEAAGNVECLRSHLDHPYTDDGRVSIRAGLYAEWLDRLVNYSQLALRTGIAERQVRIAERQGRHLAEVLNLALQDPSWGLAPGQQAVGRVVIARHLRETNGLEEVAL